MPVLIYRLLLRLYPAAFRNEYGDEMVRVFTPRCHERGVPGALLLWMEVIPDLLGSAFRQHADILVQDVRYALRTFRRNLGFTSTAILVVALGVGATTAIFSAVDLVLIRPLPFPDGGRLVQLWEDASIHGFPASEPGVGNYLDWKRLNTVFEGVAAFRGAVVNLTGVGTPERLEGAAVGADLFPLLGVSPMLGRSFTQEEDRDGGPAAIVLSYGLWQRRFGSDPAVLGRKILLDGAPFKVVGVMPPFFHFPRRDVVMWIPNRFTARDMANRDNHYIHVLARIRRGVSLEQASAEMRVIMARLRREYPRENKNIGIVVRPLRDEMGPRSRLLLLVLLGAAGSVLLIACANLANLLLARASARRKELLVRGMLGAGAERLVRQALTESVLLSLCGGLLGILIATWTMPLLARLVPESLPIGGLIQFDARVLGFGLALSLLTGITFGVLPAFQSSREALLSASKEGGREGIGGRKGSFRNALVLAEISGSVVLLVCAGLLIRTLSRLQNVDPGFRAQGLLTVQTYLPPLKYERLTARKRFYDAVLSQIRAIPGVTNAAYTSFLPLTMRGGIFEVQVEGRPADNGWTGAFFREVTPGYFATMGIPLFQGRDFQEGDRLDGVKVAVISQSFAIHYWPGENPIGKRFHFGDDMQTVVGVVGEVKARGLDRSQEPQGYVPYTQVDKSFSWFAPKDLAIRSTVDPSSLIPAVRRIISSVDPEQPISDVRTMTEIADEETAGRRQQLILLGTFAALAFLLAAVGIHGVLSFLVSQRSQEIGVRMAMGARPSDILAMIVRHGLALSTAGVLIGLAAGIAASKAMERLLFEVKPYDPLVLAASAGVCLLVSLAAAAIPAYRASRVDPISVIRCE